MWKGAGLEGRYTRVRQRATLCEKVGNYCQKCWKNEAQGDSMNLMQSGHFISHFVPLRER